MDDEIMRKMGGDKIQSIARLMLKTEELETIAFTQSQFTNSIARAQKQMEAWHFGIRKHLFDYDSVIDKQRTRIYAKRDQIAKTVGNIDATVVQSASDMLVELDVVDEIKEFVREVVGSLVTSYTAMTPRQLTELTEELRQITGASFLEEELLAYTRSDALQEALIEQVEQLFVTRIAEVDRTVVVDICKRIYLAAIDKYRVAHIDEMHYLREKV
jgi:preprotein translocase subunit SecA